MRLDEESGTATEDEEDVRARELRKQEVWLQVPPRSSDTDTGSETEVKNSQESTVDILETNENCNDVVRENCTAVELESSVDADFNSRTIIGEAVVRHASDETTDSKIIDIDSERASHDDDRCRDETIDDCRNLQEVIQASNGSSCSVSHLDVEHVDLDRRMLGSFESHSDVQSEFSDAISESNLVDEVPSSVEVDTLQVNGDNLPDLITSSPKLDKQLRIPCANIVSESGERKSVIPVLSVTAATPTAEEKRHPAIQPANNETDAYNNLKQELKLRRAKKKEVLAELRPLPSETARSKVNEYFNAAKVDRNKDELEFLDAVTVEEDPEEIRDVPIIPLGIKSQVSDKVESKDLIKYFERRTSRAMGQLVVTAIGTEKRITSLERLHDADEPFRNSEDQNEDIQEIKVISRNSMNKNEAAETTNLVPRSSEDKKESIDKEDVISGDSKDKNKAIEEANVIPRDSEVRKEAIQKENVISRDSEIKNESIDKAREVPRDSEDKNKCIEEINVGTRVSENKNAAVNGENVLPREPEVKNISIREANVISRDPENRNKSIDETDVISRDLEIKNKCMEETNVVLINSKSKSEALEEAKVVAVEPEIRGTDDEAQLNPRQEESPPVEKITIVAREIVLPTVSVPKRPERRRISHESPSDETTERTPEIPRRRRPEVKILSTEKETVIEPKINSTEHSLPQKVTSSDDRVSKERNSKPAESPSRKSAEPHKKHTLNPLKSLTLKSDHHGSNKSVASSKFDKASNKKDKCIIS